MKRTLLKSFQIYFFFKNFIHFWSFICMSVSQLKSSFQGSVIVITNTLKIFLRSFSSEGLFTLNVLRLGCKIVINGRKKFLRSLMNTNPEFAFSKSFLSIAKFFYFRNPTRLFIRKRRLIKKVWVRTLKHKCVFH